MSVAFRPSDPVRVVSCGEDNQACLFGGPPSFGTLVNSIRKFPAFVNSVRYSPDGSVFAAVSSKNILICDGETGDIKNEIADAHGGTIYSCAWSNDGALFATASADKTVKVWDAATQSCKTTFTIAAAPKITDMQVAVTFLGDGRLVSISLSGDINVLDATAPDQPARVMQGHQAAVNAMACDGLNSVVSGDSAGVVMYWKDGFGRRLGGQGHTSNVRGAVVTGDRIYTVGWDDTLRMASTESMEFAGSSALGGQPKSLAVSPKDASLVIVSTTKGISLARDGQVVSSLDLDFDVSTATIAPDGVEVAVTGNNKVRPRSFVRALVVPRTRAARVSSSSFPAGGNR